MLMAYERSDDGNSSTSSSLQILNFEKIREHCQQMSTDINRKMRTPKLSISSRYYGKSPSRRDMLPSTAPQPNEMKSDRVMKKER